MNKFNDYNVRQSITLFPDEVLHLFDTSETFSDFLVKICVDPNNTSARKTLAEFLNNNNRTIIANKHKTTLQRNTSKDENLKKYFKKLDKPIGTSLRKKVIQFDLIPYMCSVESCDLHYMNPCWTEKPITLELDHIDGDNTNNTLSNLRWLCPNCHSLTDTFRGSNVKKKKLLYDIPENMPEDFELWKAIQNVGVSRLAKHYGVGDSVINRKLYKTYTGSDPTALSRIYSIKKHMYPGTCLVCGDVTTGPGRCVDCANIYKRSKYPPLDIIIEYIKGGGIEYAGSMCDVSGNSIRKHFKKNGLNASDYSPFSHKRKDK